jgi:hypothetical protein
MQDVYEHDNVPYALFVIPTMNPGYQSYPT